jgi:hypothetical protein
LKSLDIWDMGLSLRPETSELAERFVFSSLSERSERVSSGARNKRINKELREELKRVVWRRIIASNRCSTVMGVSRT